MFGPAMLFLATSLLTVHQDLDYPHAKKVNVVDDYHGTKVEDPYRWLEEPIDTPEVRQWVDAENKLTFRYLDSIPGRDGLMAELQRRINFERYEVPFQQGGKIFYSHNDGLQNQNVLFVTSSLTGSARVLLDPNKLSSDGTVALNGLDVSDDGKMLLYGTSSGGSDWIEWHVRDVSTGKDLEDTVKWSKFVGEWDKSGKGFYYLSFPQPKEGKTFTTANSEPSVRYHALGTSQDADKLIYELSTHPDWYVWPQLDETKTTMWLSINPPGETGNRLYMLDLATKKVTKIVDEGGSEVTPVSRSGNKAILWTNNKAPFGRVVEFNLAKPSWRSAKTLIKETKDTLQSVNLVGNRLILTTMQDARSAVGTYSTAGKLLSKVKLPGLGTVAGFAGKRKDQTTYYSYSDFGTPARIYSYDVKSNTSKLFRSPKLPFDNSKYVAEQVFYASKDGTRVPMFIVHKKGLKMDGQNPTLLYGYGGFNIPMQPWFSSSRTVWMDMGGVWCLANIRGGGEYGQAWHESAIKLHRQRAFEDFIAAGEWLISHKICSKSTLAIQGGSNGGLLVGAVMTQRPDLMGVAIPEVGVMDMLRFNQFTVGKGWESDFGSPQNPAEFAAIFKYSPYHNLRKGTVYPATLITTADTDDRVVPAHSFKFAARLQEFQGGKAPVLIRIETSAGHGGGKPITKALEEVRDIYAFILHNMGKRIPEHF